MHLLVSMVFLLLLSVFVTSVARAQADFNWETYWPDDDSDKIIDAINEGELNFLDTSPDVSAPYHQNTFTILKSSLETGWIKLAQCYENLDTFPRVQIVYNKGRIRHLRITRKKNISDARIEDNTVQLTNVNSNALLCVQGESRALIAQKDGSYILQNGPFMRQFFDGYFPIRVSIDVKFPVNLSFIAVEPVEQKGFSVIKKKQELHLDTWFEGRLLTRFKFKRIPETEIQ